MSACNTSCTTVSEILIRVARQLGDYSDTTTDQFVTWSQATLLDLYNEAALMVAANRPDAFAKVVDITLEPGSVQSLPDGYRGLVKIDLNIDGNGAEAEQINAADEYFTKIMAKKDCLPKGCVGTQRDYVVKSYAKSSFTDTQFTVSPPVPPGTHPRVKAVVLGNPTKVCDTSKCIEFDEKYAPAAVEWMLYRVWSSDAEIVGGANAAALHRNTFFQILGVQLQREQQYYAGGFRPGQAIQQVAR